MKISDLKPSRVCPPEVIELAVTSLSSLPVSSAANFCVVFKAGDEFKVENHFGRPCHVGLGNQITKGTFREAIGLYTKTDKIESEGFLRWFVEESFVKAFILAKTPEGVVVDADIPPELLQNIAIMSRHSREVSLSAFLMFDYIRSKGYRGETAYALAMNSGIAADKPLNDILRYPVGDGLGGHRAWRMFSYEALRRFLDDDFGSALDEAVKKPSARTRATIYGGLLLCDTGTPDQRGHMYQKYDENFVTTLMTSPAQQKFRDLLSDFRKKSQTEAYRPPNPFAPSIRTIPSSTMTFEELIEVALPYLKQEGFSV